VLCLLSYIGLPMAGIEPAAPFAKKPLLRHSLWIKKMVGATGSSGGDYSCASTPRKANRGANPSLGVRI